MMTRRDLSVGRWAVEFYFSDEEGYDEDILIDRMFDHGAGAPIIGRAMALIEKNAPNTGFTFSNPMDRVAIVAIGPTTSGEEFINTLVHELHHLAVAIADSLGIDLDSEAPAYIAGDSALALADIICKMGCSHCRK